jgi:SAM-dependent methyltransferase
LEQGDQHRRLESDLQQSPLITAPTAPQEAYQQVLYPGYVYPQTHPARLEVVGRMFGLKPAGARSCRVLELGCGDGTNSLAIAETLPEASVVGVDIAPGPLEGGRALAAAAGLGNVEFRCADLLDPSWVDDIGEVDYVVAHGVYSWVPPAARGALLECCRRCLAPHGVAFVSYNAYPGSYLRDMSRDILAFHLQGVASPRERIVRAHHLMQTIVSVESPSPYARVLREHLQRMLGASDALLYHDDLAAVSTPFYFHEFIEHATAHELQFISEAELSDSQMRDVPTAVGELIAGLPDDVIVREQYLDFFNNRMFRQTLLTRANAPVKRIIEARVLDGLAVSSPARRDGSRFLTDQGAALTTTEPLVAAAMNELSDRWPASLIFGDLVAAASHRLAPATPDAHAVDRLRSVLLDAYLLRVVWLSGCELPATGHPGSHPRGGSLARAQAASGRSVVSSLLPGNYQLADELEPRLLAVLDGTRDHAALAGELNTPEPAVQAAVSRLTAEGLLAG